MGLKIVVLHGDAPLQALGYVDGYPFYFRARGDYWEFALASARELNFEGAIAATAQAGHGLLLRKRFNDTAGDLSEEKARRIIARAARAALAFIE